MSSYILTLFHLVSLSTLHAKCHILVFVSNCWYQSMWCECFPNWAFNQLFLCQDLHSFIPLLSNWALLSVCLLHDFCLVLPVAHLQSAAFNSNLGFCKKLIRGCLLTEQIRNTKQEKCKTTKYKDIQRQRNNIKYQRNKKTDILFNSGLLEKLITYCWAECKSTKERWWVVAGNTSYTKMYWTPSHIWHI